LPELSTEKVAMEEKCIREVYARRDLSGKKRLYDAARPDALYIQRRCQQAWQRAITEAGLMPLDKCEVLDLGCGHGGWLRMLHEWGADPARLHGVDLLADRIEQARFLSPPEFDLRLGNGLRLDYPDRSFDFCAASTVFSSILDKDVQLAVAEELTRVLRPGGWLMLFDYAISDPRNPDTIGISLRRLKAIFRGMNLASVDKLLLPAPVLRRLPASLLNVVQAFEVIGLFCTHRLHRFRKP